MNPDLTVPLMLVVVCLDGESKSLEGVIIIYHNILLPVAMPQTYTCKLLNIFLKKKDEETRVFLSN